MTGEVKRRVGATTAWIVAAGCAAAAVAWVGFGAEIAETAPAPRPDVYEVSVRGPAGGFEADVSGVTQAVVFATRAPDGKVIVDCSDHETATAIVAGVLP